MLELVGEEEDRTAKRPRTADVTAAAAALQNKFVSYGDAAEIPMERVADNPPTNFSVDWFSHNVQRLARVLTNAGLFGTVQAALRSALLRAGLEVGCFEGRSTVWFLQNLIAKCGTMVCIDTFDGDIALQTSGRSSSQVEQAFDENTQQQTVADQPTVLKRKGRSVTQLMLLNQEKWKFSFIYIDGSHEAPDVLSDSVLAFQMLEPGGVLVWDDYQWDTVVALPEHRCPRIAIDAFLSVHKHELVVLDKGYQVIVKRK